MNINSTSAQLASGRYLDYADPQSDQFTVNDIALALARECRFVGQTAQPYSVAQHSVLVSLLVPKEFSLAGLFHDGSEAVMRDVSTPMKSLLPDYRMMEHRVQAAIQQKIGLGAHMPAHVHSFIKRADLIAFATERAQLMPTDGHKWPGVEHIQPLDFIIQPMSEKQARFYFLDRYVSIVNDRPFIKERQLWQAQHDEWAQRMADVARQQEDEEPPVVRERVRMRG